MKQLILIASLLILGSSNISATPIKVFCEFDEVTVWSKKTVGTYDELGNYSQPEDDWKDWKMKLIQFWEFDDKEDVFINIEWKAENYSFPRTEEWTTESETTDEGFRVQQRVGYPITQPRVYPQYYMNHELNRYMGTATFDFFKITESWDYMADEARSSKCEVYEKKF